MDIRVYGMYFWNLSCLTPFIVQTSGKIAKQIAQHLIWLRKRLTEADDDLDDAIQQSPVWQAMARNGGCLKICQKLFISRQLLTPFIFDSLNPTKIQDTSNSSDSNTPNSSALSNHTSATSLFFDMPIP